MPDRVMISDEISSSDIFDVSAIVAIFAIAASNRAAASEHSKSVCPISFTVAVIPAAANADARLSTAFFDLSPNFLDLFAASSVSFPY